MPEVKQFNTFLKKDRFLSKIGKSLLSRYLCKLEIVFAVVTYRAKNLSKAMTIANKVLQHSPNNYTSPAKNYTIVNYQKKRQFHDQAKVIKLFNEN